MNREQTIIYAVGGGHGHAVRGILIGDKLRDEGYDVTVLIRKDSLQNIQDLPSDIPYIEVTSPEETIDYTGDNLVIDTFPFGWWNEYGVSWLHEFSKRIFLARYRKDLILNDIAPLFDEIWLPYDENNSEWEEITPNSKFIGLIIKELLPSFIPSQSFVLFDPERRCSETFISKVREIISKAGYTFEIKYSFESVMNASKMLVIGAGYNTFYELQKCTIDARFIPVNKKCDDQIHRVSKLNKGIFSSNDIVDWL